MKYTRYASLFLMIILCTVLTACENTSTTGATSSTALTLKVFAASSLLESFGTLAQRYHKIHPLVTITYNFAGSQVLEQQLASGASADIFASADNANMQKASAAGLVEPAHIFAKNKLVVIVSRHSSTHITSLKDLTRNGVKIDIEAASVPAGQYTLQVLDKMSYSPEYGPTYKAAVLGHVVSQEDNVKAVVQKVQLGEADAGFVYQTDVTASVSSQVDTIPIPDTLNVIAQYPIAALKQSSHPTEAQTFVQYVLSPDGQAILAQYHFLGV
ncbi:molybdenum ABC transporter substrate-binding protein [Reticulibacter mediterranei]|uniref:Molybdenum ABC transporter substrate-binding protein n=1 Tax=Reticulibacter mediterranei TaxID=2778369 RepID=A0A8J3IPR8_9CHLR|nr:molybdate ABC transporter substrate-binding protein [Reticulibacter mediterranei]GHO94650.1 molybdenum ABC transporter substrate-binding protein [Reticulibacter mediterranei]